MDPITPQHKLPGNPCCPIQFPVVLSSVDPEMWKLFSTLDIGTRLHSWRVRDLSLSLGRAIHLNPGDLEALGIAALFHDIGKISLDQQILTSRKNLTADDRAQILIHPQNGAHLWASHGGCTRISQAILTHHERFDGSGYPLGLTGNQIPLFGRIIAIVDAFDAMRSSRHYAGSIPVQLALSKIRLASGRQFDPFLVRLSASHVFISSLQEVRQQSTLTVSEKSDYPKTG